jgi:hypothetical protein
MKTCSVHGEIIAAPIKWRTEAFLRQWRCGSNSERKLCNRFELADFFLVRAASLFTLRTFGAQINWCVISRKALFDPHRFLSNKSPIHFAGESGKGNTFLNGKRHVQNENGHRSPLGLRVIEGYGALPAFGLLDQLQVGDTGPAESTQQGNLQRVGLLFLGSRDSHCPRLMPNNCTNLNPSYFSLPSTFK